MRNAWRTTAVTIRDGRGPERVAVEPPPPDWTPPTPVGFAPPETPESSTPPGDPILWDGDNG